METQRPAQPDAGSAPFDCDVFVIGGGPAGATVAALLARAGRSVLLAEKSHHPRFHIGESLLPANAPLFDRLGVRDAVDRIGMRKWGVEFVSPDHAHTTRLAFAESWDPQLDRAWQVRRADLDRILFERAQQDGARTLEGCRVRRIAFDAVGADIEAELDTGDADPSSPAERRRWRARYVVDASGRDTVLANQFGIKQKNPRHNSSALFGHFANAERADGMREGDITIFWFAHGWFWYIPLADGSVSIGAVCWPYYLKSRAKPLPEFFADTIALCPPLAQRLTAARLIDGKVYATGNYAYSASHCTDERYVLLGDAFTFIDPVFSSGVYMAMHGAFEAVALIDAHLDRPAAAAAARRHFERTMRIAPREFSWFIFRVTNPAMREFFMHPRNPLGVKSALLSLLAGDIHRGTPIWGSLLVFKGMYFIASALRPRRTWQAWQRRRRNIRGAGKVPGENVQPG
ncbi:MAG: FAD-binding protein [Burkholderiaceae bacterium]|jgi:flavin-dependent dehydrogenase|nr:MAG: FAD-binding protein [Burkholderiaceae bacterium]